MGDLTKNFDRSEFACKCGCGFDAIDQEFVEQLQILRDTIGKPLRINSGCRCEKHNAEVEGVPHSAHMRGLAADIDCRDGEFRLRLIKAVLALDWVRVGIGKTFIHLDDDPDLPQPRIWLY